MIIAIGGLKEGAELASATPFSNEKQHKFKGQILISNSTFLKNYTARSYSGGSRIFLSRGWTTKEWLEKKKIHKTKQANTKKKASSQRWGCKTNNAN